MRTITTEQINKACRSRSLKEIDEVMMRVKLELIQIEQEFEQEQKRPNLSQKYEINLLKYGLERLENRISYLSKRAIDAQKKREENAARLQMYVDFAKARMPMHSAIEQLQLNAELANKVVIGAPIVTGDNAGDINSNFLADKAMTDKANGVKITPEWFSQTAKEIKEKDKASFSIEDLFKPNDDGSVDL